MCDREKKGKLWLLVCSWKVIVTYETALNNLEVNVELRIIINNQLISAAKLPRAVLFSQQCNNNMTWV